MKPIHKECAASPMNERCHKCRPPDLPTFETWTHENLAKFALEAYLKMQAQHDLIQYLRMLVASTPRSSDAEKIDPPLA